MSERISERKDEWIQDYVTLKEMTSEDLGRPMKKLEFGFQTCRMKS